MINCKASLSKQVNKKVELLVPVGGYKQLIAAVENGADSVYLGGEISNARMSADNFGRDEVERAVDYAHLRGTKVFITMNTLMFDDEIESAIDYAAFLYSIGVDALIVQDLGLAYLIHENMPDFNLHLSTQGTVMTEAGIRQAKDLGFSRVVLARELTLGEISDLAKFNITELEVFVHGAMCVSMSGQCHMSRFIGGRSGNRGMCAQPCRLPFKCFDESMKINSSNPYPLSTKDLCLIDYVGELIDMGIASLKIEGRMKSPEYVAIVTSIYRKYIDNRNLKVTEGDRIALLQAFNRNGFSEGFNTPEDTLSRTIGKNSGVYVGKVIKAVQNSALYDIKLHEDVRIGDIVEIRGKNNTTNMVTYHKELKGGLTRLGDFKGTAAHGDPIYRLVSKELNDEVKLSYEHGKFIKKTDVDFEISFDETATADSSKNEAIIKRQLSKTGNTPFKVNEIKINGIPVSVKVSEINELRRTALEKLSDRIIESYKREKPEIKISVCSDSNDKKKQTEIFFYDGKKALNYDLASYKDFRLLIPMNDYINMTKLERKKLEEVNNEIGLCVLPFDCLRELIKGINISSECVKYIYVGGFGDINIAAEAFKDLTVVADFGTNSTNSYTKALLKRLGAKEVINSLEIDENQYGELPLMITRHKIDCKQIIDRKGASYLVIEVYSDKYGEFNIITPEKHVFDYKKIPFGRVWIG